MGRVTQLIAAFLLALLCRLSTSVPVGKDRQFPTYRFSRHLHQRVQSTSNEGTTSSREYPMSVMSSDPVEFEVEDLEELANFAQRVKRASGNGQTPSTDCKEINLIINLLTTPFNVQAVKYLNNQNEFQPNLVTVLDLLVRYGFYGGNSEYPRARRDADEYVYGKKTHTYHVTSPPYHKTNHTYHATSPPYHKMNHTYHATSPPYHKTNHTYHATSPPYHKTNHTYHATSPPYHKQETHYEASKPSKDYGVTDNEYNKGSYLEEDDEEEEAYERQSETYEAPAPLPLDYFDQEDLLFLYNLNEFAENSRFALKHLVYILNFLQDLIDFNNSKMNNGGGNNNVNNGGGNNNDGRRKRHFRPRAEDDTKQIEEEAEISIDFLTKRQGPPTSIF